jgi:hypothetical protein
MTARLELERIISDWLMSDVNARIAAVPKDASDPVPQAIATYTDTTYTTNQTIAVFNSVTHPWVAEWKSPPADPAIYVVARGPFIFAGEPTPDGRVRKTVVPAKVGIFYIRENADAAIARRDGSYTLRAIARSIRELDKEAPASDAARLRNGINVVLSEGPQEFYPTVTTVGNHRVSGALVLNYHVRDENPAY